MNTNDNNEYKSVYIIKLMIEEEKKCQKQYNM